MTQCYWKLEVAPTVEEFLQGVFQKGCRHVRLVLGPLFVKKVHARVNVVRHIAIVVHQLDETLEWFQKETELVAVPPEDLVVEDGDDGGGVGEVPDKPSHCIMPILVGIDDGTRGGYSTTTLEADDVVGRYYYMLS